MWASLLVAVAVGSGCTPANDDADSAAVAQPVAKPDQPPSSVELEVRGPERATVDQPVSIRLMVTNRGETPATGLRLRHTFEPGLAHATEKSPVESPVDDLAPGKSRMLRFDLRATKTGWFNYTADLLAGDDLVASGFSEVTVTSLAEAVPQEGDGQSQGSAGVAEEPDPQAYQPPDLGPPLNFQEKQLQKLHPLYPVWITRDQKSVVIVGEVCQRETPLELFVCLRGSKEHESVVVVDSKAYVIHAGLLACRADPGNPVQFYPEYVPARGPEIEVTVVWKDEKGQVHRARGQDWVRDAETGKAMKYAWVFAGSRFVKDEQTGQQHYQADFEGDLICVSNFPAAVLDVPVKSSDSDASLLFDAFTERIPPRGTPVTLVLTPKAKGKPDGDQPGQDTPQPPDPGPADERPAPAETPGDDSSTPTGET